MPTTTVSRSRWAARVLLLLFALSGTAGVAGWVVARWFVLPHIAQWQGAIEARISQRISAPVRIGSIKVHAGGWAPAIELHDVRVLDAEKHTALILPSIIASGEAPVADPPATTAAPAS